MRTSAKGISLIQYFEGFSAVPYRCPGGYSTIGYGHLIRHGEKWDRIDTDIANQLLHKDIAEAEFALACFANIELSNYQWDALISFVFNLGAGAFERSTLRRRVNRGDHRAAQSEFLRWIWAGGRPLEGLRRRRKAESLLYSGIIPEVIDGIA